MEEDFDIQAALDDAKFALAETAESIRTTKESARTIFSAASIIIALFGVFQVFSATAPAEKDVVFNCLLIAILLAYVILIGLCLYVLMPMKWINPILPDWDVYSEAYFKKSHRDILKQKLVNTLDVIPKNRKIIKQRTRMVYYSGVCFVAIVLMLSGLVVYIH